MISVLASSVVDIVGFSPDRVKPKTVKLVFVASPLNMLNKKEGANTGWFVQNQTNVSESNGMYIPDCRFEELAL